MCIYVDNGVGKLWVQGKWLSNINNDFLKWGEYGGGGGCGQQHSILWVGKTNTVKPVL
jgi:hypothetical protein